MSADNTVSSISGSFSVSDGTIRTRDLDYFGHIYENRPTWINWIKYWIYKKLYSKQLNIHIKKQINPEQLATFFDSIKVNTNELTKNNIEEIIEKYNTVLNNAKYNNQIALVERIEDYAEILKCEIILSTSEFNKYLTEDDIVEFYNLASKHEKYNTGLCLTYIKKFH